MADPTNIKDYFEQHARSGNAGYAIAFSLLELAEAQEYLGTRVARLGFEGPGSVPAPGAFEFIGMQLRDIASALDNLTVSASVDLNNNA